MAKIKRSFHVNDIANMSKDEVWSLPDGGLWVTFADGKKVKCKTRPVIYSWYYWQMPKAYPGLQLTEAHFLGNNYYTKDSHTDLGFGVLWDTFFAHNPTNHMLVWDISKKFYEVTNDIYNDVVVKLNPFMGTVSLIDYMEVITHPKVLQWDKDYELDKIDINQYHKKVFGLLQSDDELLTNNNVVSAVKAKLVNYRQVVQLLATRGFMSDVNGEAATYDIRGCFTKGLHSAYDSLIESRAASIALFMAESPLQLSEYNNRMCQLLCGAIRKVTYGAQGDCGSKHYCVLPVTKKNLKDLAGKNILQEDGSLKMAVGNEEHLIGTVVQYRSITTCTNHDPGTVCQTCVGFNALIVPPGTSPGYMLSIEPLSRISQIILSAKHVISSTKVLYLDTGGATASYLRLDPDDKFNVLALKPPKGLSRKIKFRGEDALFLSDIQNVDMSKINHTDITAITSLMVEDTHDGKHIATNSMDTKVGPNGSPFSKEFLIYLKEKGWEVNGNFYQVSLDDWDYSKPIIRTRRIGEDIMAILNNFQKFIKSGNDDKNDGDYKSITSYDSPGPAIEALYNILSEKIDVNITHVEVFVRALMCDVDSYALPRGGEPFRFDKLKGILENRSLSALLAFQGQDKALSTMRSYNPPGRPTIHPMDGVWAQTKRAVVQ